MRGVGPSLQTVSTGVVVAIVGFFSSFAIVLQGVTGMGASPAEAASGLMAAAIAMGLAGIGLSLWTRMPVSVAWSTPGAALLAVSAVPEAGFAGAVAGFVVAGVLTVVAGLWRPVARLAENIPVPLAQAMLAGVLMPLCLVPFQGMATAPTYTVPVVLAWFGMRFVSPLFAVPAAVVVAGLLTWFAAGDDILLSGGLLSEPVFVMPEFSVSAALSVGLPLFIVTMATQNIPGIAVVRGFGYRPKAGPLIANVGGMSVLSAPFGAPATCLAAITAAMCANEASDPDPARRYWSAVIAGLVYCLFGLFAGVITGFAGLAPPMVMGTLAGVALLGVFAGSAAAALEEPGTREAAAVTFLVTVSGISVLGLGAAVWGLVLGGAVLWVRRRQA